MIEFKVGDKVRIKNENTNFHYFCEGVEGAITRKERKAEFGGLLFGIEVPDTWRGEVFNDGRGNEDYKFQWIKAEDLELLGVYDD